YGLAYEDLDGSDQAALQHRLRTEYRRNTYDAASGTVTVTARRAQAMPQTADYYARLYGDDPALRQTREHYAMKEGTLPDAGRRQALTQFFFWTAWAAATERPGQH